MPELTGTGGVTSLPLSIEQLSCGRELIIHILYIKLLTFPINSYLWFFYTKDIVYYFFFISNYVFTTLHYDWGYFSINNYNMILTMILILEIVLLSYMYLICWNPFLINHAYVDWINCSVFHNLIQYITRMCALK